MNDILQKLGNQKHFCSIFEFEMQNRFLLAQGAIVFWNDGFFLQCQNFSKDLS